MLVIGLSAQVLVSQPLHQAFVDDDDDYEEYDDYDDDDYDDDYDDDDQKRLARPKQTGGKVHPDYLDKKLDKNPNFINPEVTSDDDPKQGLEIGQVLDNGDTVEDLTIKEETPIPTLAQGNKEKQYKDAKNQEKINTVTVKDPNEASQTQAIKVNEKTKKDVNTNTYIDETLLNEELLTLLNADRQAAGLRPVEYGTHLQEGVNTRSNDLATIGHIRVNNQPHVRLDDSRNHWWP